MWCAPKLINVSFTVNIGYFKTRQKKKKKYISCFVDPETYVSTVGIARKTVISEKIVLQILE